jgi:hypothetical protein
MVHSGCSGVSYFCWATVSFAVLSRGAYILMFSFLGNETPNDSNFNGATVDGGSVVLAAAVVKN